jgi:hypothetical protein
MSYNEILEQILFINIDKEEATENINFNFIHTYVIIDAARIKKLTNELIALTDIKYENLFMPYEQESLEEVAPYLIELKKDDEFTTWVYENVYGKLGSLFLHSILNIEELSNHFRPYITTTSSVPNPNDKTELMETETYVRLYDPRVFPRFINKLKDDRGSFFLNIEAVYVENKKSADELLKFQGEQEEVISLIKEVE